MNTTARPRHPFHFVSFLLAATVVASACDTADGIDAVDVEGTSAFAETEAEPADELPAPIDEPADSPDPSATDDLVIELDPAAFNSETPWFSEEQGPAMCPWGQVANGMRCSGSYCDSVKIGCNAYLGAPLGGSWRPAISEEGGNNLMLCPGDGMVDGASCSGSYCDNISFHCVDTTLHKTNNCGWTGWFSEETPAWTTIVSGEQAVAGVQCRGRYCDDMRMYLCSMAL